MGLRQEQYGLHSCLIRSGQRYARTALLRVAQRAYSAQLHAFPSDHAT